MVNTRLLDGVQALVFDTYGTVVDWRGGVLEVARGLRGAQGVAGDWDAFLVDWDTRPILDLINTGQMPWMTMEAVHRHALGLSLARFGMAGLTDGVRDAQACYTQPLTGAYCFVPSTQSLRRCSDG